MSALSGVPMLISFFLLGLQVATWATINGKVLGVILIVTAILILIDLVYSHRGVFTTRRQTVVTQ
jgi:hypothetical protein